MVLTGVEAHGLVARWWHRTKAAAATRVRLTGALAGAVAATHVETDVEGRAAMPLSADGSLEVRFTRQQLRTVRLLPLAPGASAVWAGAASEKHEESPAVIRFAGPEGRLPALAMKARFRPGAVAGLSYAQQSFTANGPAGRTGVMYD